MQLKINWNLEFPYRLYELWRGRFRAYVPIALFYLTHDEAGHDQSDEDRY